LSRIGRCLRALYEVWYFSRIQVGLAAAAMSAASSAVLLPRTDGGVLLLAAVLTLCIYWTDDWLDATRDERDFPVLAAVSSWRRPLLLLLAAGSGLYAIAILIRLERVRMLVLVLGLISAGLCVVSRWSPGTRNRAAWPLVRATAVALAWAGTCVLLPVAAAGAPIGAREAVCLIFFFLLMLPVALMWSRARHGSGASPFSPYAGKLGAALLGLCFISGAMVIVGIAIGLFPWYNLAVAVAPAANVFFLLLGRWVTLTEPRWLSDLLVVVNTLCAVLVTGAWRRGLPGPAGPHTPADWTALAGISVLAALVASQIARTAKRADGHPVMLGSGGVRMSDAADLIWIFGTCIFAFQTLIATCHVEMWLLPALHQPLLPAAHTWSIGAVLVACALLLVTAAYRQMGAAWRIGIDRTRPVRIVSGGLFAFSRNPIYLGVDLFLLGFFFLIPDLTFLLFAVLGPIFLDRQIRAEEAFLETAGGGGYCHYRRQVGRYFGHGGNA